MSNRCVVAYDELQYKMIRNRPKIKRTIEELEKVIGNLYAIAKEQNCCSPVHACILDIQGIIYYLRNVEDIGYVKIFPFDDFINGTIIPENDIIYVVKNKEYYYE